MSYVIINDVLNSDTGEWVKRKIKLYIAKNAILKVRMSTSI